MLYSGSWREIIPQIVSNENLRQSLETTHMYLQADLAMKEKALEKLEPIKGEWKRFHADDPLLAFLAAL
jgi:hypothetical protein